MDKINKLQVIRKKLSDWKDPYRLDPNISVKEKAEELDNMIKTVSELGVLLVVVSRDYEILKPAQGPYNLMGGFVPRYLEIIDYAIQKISEKEGKI